MKLNLYLCMDLVKHSIRVLRDTYCITLPALGKFELLFESVRTDPETRKNYPPGYQILFSQQHNLNDDSLIREIAASESQDAEQVKKEVNEIISNWKNRLKSEGSLKLDGWGIFTSHKEKIEFQMGDDCIFKFKNFGLPIV